MYEWYYKTREKRVKRSRKSDLLIGKTDEKIEYKKRIGTGTFISYHFSIKSVCSSGLNYRKSESRKSKDR
jgi:hypothetical protein